MEMDQSLVDRVKKAAALGVSVEAIEYVESKQIDRQRGGEQRKRDAQACIIITNFIC